MMSGKSGAICRSCPESDIDASMGPGFANFCIQTPRSYLKSTEIGFLHHEIL